MAIAKVKDDLFVHYLKVPDPPYTESKVVRLVHLESQFKPTRDFILWWIEHEAIAYTVAARELGFDHHTIYHWVHRTRHSSSNQDILDGFAEYIPEVSDLDRVVSDYRRAMKGATNEPG